MSKLTVVLILCCNIWYIESRSQSLGSSCSFIRNGVGKPGTCKEIEACPEILNLWKIHNIDPQLCIEKSSIVCCPTIEEVVAVSSLNRISAQKCREYSVNKGETCESVPGAKESGREFQHMAMLGYKSNDGFEFLCGASLISELFVISTAHCAYFGEENGPDHVKLGKETENSFIVYVEKIFIHPSFNDKMLHHNIALFKLSRAVHFNSYIRPICLPYMDEQAISAIVTGWGYEGYGFDLKMDFMQATLTIFNQSECQLNNNLPLIDDKTKLCAGTFTEINDAHISDTGGPLQIENMDGVHCMYTIIGVSSYGNENYAGIPGIFTKVFYYINWIENIVWPS